MHKKASWMLPMLLFLFSLSAACSGDGPAGGPSGANTSGPEEASGYPLTITDAVGREVTFDSRPKRIVSMAPSVTETLFAVGAANRVVGVTTADDYPPEVEAVERVGDYRGPNVEKVLSLNTDLMILSFDGATEGYAEDMAEKTRTKVVVLNPKTVDAAISSVGLVAKLVGEREKGRVVEERLRDELGRIGEKVAGEPKPTVFYEVWGDPLQTAGPGSFIDDAIRLAEGTNVAADTGDAYPEYSKETLLQRDPDYYLAGRSSGVTVEEISGRPGYPALGAVKDGRVTVVNDDLVVRPGPRIVDGVREIAEAIHPKAFD